MQFVMSLLQYLKYTTCLVVLLMPLESMAAWFKDEQAIMGTRIAVEYWYEGSGNASQCNELVMAEMRRINVAMSPYREDSELSRINQQAADHPVKISKELFDLIGRAQHYSELSNGAFDITFASVGHLYDYRNRVKPSDAELQDKLSAINYKFIQLNNKNQTIQFSRSGVRIDLGGIAKGYAVDNGIRILEECGIKHAIVTAGGDSRIMGDRHGRPWMVGVREPRSKDGVKVALPLVDTAISTSGDYERFFIEDGKRYHHIISPSTGQSVSSVSSVTVIGPDALSTDALSTTVFVLGPVRGMELIERLEGIDAVIIDAQGQMHYSSGLMPPTPEPAPAGPEIR